MRWAPAALALLLLPAGTVGAPSPFPEGHGPPVAVSVTSAADTTLYVHLTQVADSPLTLQAPTGGQADEGNGLTPASLSCVPAGTPLDGLAQHQYTTYYAYAALGGLRNGQDPGTPERGLAADLRLDPAAPLRLHWFMSTATAAGASTAGDPVPVPDVVLRATVRAGERITIGDVGYNEGALVAQGQTVPTTLAGAATAATPGADGSRAAPGAQVTYAGAVGGVPVYAFTLPLPDVRPALAAQEGFNLRVDLFQSLPACPDPSRGYVMANLVRAHTSPGLRPRLEVREVAPLQLHAELEQFVEAQVLHVSAASPWGLDDLDGANATLAVTPAAAFAQVAAPPSRSLDGRERLPLEQVWVWNRTLRPGSYTATYAVADRQHTASAQATVTFQVGARAAPAAGPLEAVALLAVAAAFRRAQRGAGRAGFKTPRPVPPSCPT